MFEKNKTLIYLAIAAVFGIMGGIAGDLFSRAYLIEKYFKIPMFGELNFNATDYNKSNIVISNPKKVVVEQSERVSSIAKSAQSGIARIYQKKAPAKAVGTSSVFSVKDYYSSADEVGRAFVITADGWLLSRFAPEEAGKVPDTDAKEAAKGTSSKPYLKYVIEISGKIYNVKNAIRESSGKYHYWQVDAGDLPVQTILSSGEIANGDSVLLLNRYGQIWLANAYGKSSDQPKAILSSDGIFSEVLINNTPPDTFVNSFVFNINGGLMGILNDQKQIILFENSSDIIHGLSKSGKYQPTRFGVYYTNLADLSEGELSKPDKSGIIIVKNDKGVAVEKGLIADKAGFKESDIITHVGGIGIDKDNTFKKLLSGIRPESEAEFRFIRAGKENTVRIKF